MSSEPRVETRLHRSFCLPLTCPPSRPTADTATKQLVDVIQPTGMWQWLYFAGVAALVTAAPFLATRPGLAVGALAASAGAAWCLANFWRCREAHCVVTGVGWTALFVLEAGELAIGRSLIHGTESSVFAGVLIIGLVFECAWQVCCGTNALTRQTTASRS